MNIRDIANLAGVSASTVSKVMNGKDKDISEETRKKVLEVIEREHYVPYFKFLDKAGMKNRLVGLILQKNNQEKERYIAVVIETPCMPKAGETIAGKSIAQIPGGKGANQAFAAGKLGGNIAMMGAVGNDEKGEKLLESLKGVGVDISRIEVMNDIPTGQAFITVDDQGENAIIIIAGANGKITKELIDSNLALIKQSDIIIMQLEIPLEIVGYVKKIVEEDGKIVILDPAPAIKDIPENILKGIDYIKPNETELQILTGMEVLMSGIQDVTMIGLDVTNKIALDGSMREILRMLNTKLSTFVYNITQEGMDENWRSRRKAVSPMHDVLTVAYFLDNSIVKLKPAYIDVVTEGIARGQSIVDIGGHWNENKCNAKYAYDVDVVKFYKLFYKEIFNEDITDLVEGK